MEFSRIEVLQRRIAPDAQCLEIGPLWRPVLGKDQFNVRYIDFTTAEVLAAKYANDGDVGDVVEVDIVWDGSGPLATAVDDRADFDAVVASHVVEHVPNPVRWMAEIASVLRPGGLLTLAVPDKRFTFDCNRRLTEVGDLIDAYLRLLQRPSYAQIYDFHTKSIPVDADFLWAGERQYQTVVRHGELSREAYESCLAQRDGAAYEDVHCSVFTPHSFIDIIEELSRLDLFEYEVIDLVPTQSDLVEFFVHLRRLDPHLSPAQRVQAQAAGLLLARESIDAGPRPASEGSDAGYARRQTSPVVKDAILYRISTREQQAILAKRRALTALRRLIGRAP